ncbi:hypothetical protein ACFYXC_30640 [Streptomyces sp. NPDC002701]|uniref:hypothetical protein n=1 Tax=Streptomyces sp. NPDC002701 TaxID=3364661 RepID=UPI00368CD3C0
MGSGTGLSDRWAGARIGASDDGADSDDDADADADADGADGSPRISETNPGACPVLGVLMCLNRPLDRRV